jgi:hypothetical protein
MQALVAFKVREAYIVNYLDRQYVAYYNERQAMAAWLKRLPLENRLRKGPRT